MNALAFWDNLLRRFPALKVIENPVVMRDLRAQMRGARSYWYIGGYLLLIGILAVAGYAQSTGQSLNPTQWEAQREPNIVDAQAKLEGFYWFIFGTLALLITVIAPALTAASIVGERQRQSFDLLVTTPLTANQLLIGKLLSSIAFLGFLLLLSMPAAALCVLLGGATVSDVFRIYLLLTVDSIVLSAIGLYFSSTVRIPLLATVWTYIAVAGVFLATAFVSSGAWNPGYLQHQIPPIFSLVWLNPVAAVSPVASGESGGWLLLFRLATFLGLAALIVRLLLAAATYRLGLFGSHSGVTVRRLSLLLIAVVVGFVANDFVANDLARRLSIANVDLENALSRNLVLLGTLPLMVFLAILPFLPGLFVPASVEDAPPGTTTETAADPKRHRLFHLSRLFHPQHSGALPWYVAFVVTVLLAIVAGVLPYGDRIAHGIPVLLASGFYLLGMGAVTWSLSRFASSIVPELSPARAAAFALYICVLGLPVLLFTLQMGEWKENPLAHLWLLSPFLYTSEAHPGRLIESLIRCGILGFSVAMVVYLIEQGVRGGERLAAQTSEVH